MHSSLTTWRATCLSREPVELTPGSLSGRAMKQKIEPLASSPKNLGPVSASIKADEAFDQRRAKGRLSQLVNLHNGAKVPAR